MNRVKNSSQQNNVPPEQDNSVVGTMRINPRQFKPKSNKTDLDRTKYAVAGLLYLLRREQTIRNILLTTLVVLGLAWWLQLDIIHTMIIFVSLGLVWTTETMNCAVEAVVDLVTQELHPLAKVAKDVAASATLMATFTSSMTTLVIMGPPLVSKLSMLLG